MSSVCADNRYHHHHHHHPLFSQDHLIIPPRRLFNTQQTKLLISTSGHKRPQQEQQSYVNVDDEEGIDDDGGCGGVDDVDDDDEEEDGPFATDEFRMYEFKVRRCMRSRSHDWTDCPFAHPGEKARRRDPRRFHYSGDACADFRRGSCARGDSCEFAHGVFECWLHPARYRTHACKDGKSCKRKVCFFAHSPRELRVLPSSSSSSKQCCCRGFCRNNSSMSRSFSSSSNNPCYDNHSPTSTLMGISHLMPSSPTMSPPSSPSDATAGLVSAKSRGVINGRKSGDFTKSMSYKSAVLELARSLKAMEISGNNINNIACSNGDYSHQLSWSDHHHHHHQDQEQFVLSPYCSTPTKVNSLINYYVASSPEPRSADVFNEDSNGTGGQFPDLEWVNELVM